MKTLRQRLSITAVVFGLAALCSTVYLGAFVSGCAGQTGGVGSVITDTNTINVVSNYLTAAVSEAVAYGLSQDKTNTTAYASLASAAIGEVVGGSDFSPGALDAALQKLPVNVLKSPAAGVITLAIESLYQIYWASDVNGAVNGDYAAKSYLGAVQAGIQKALNGQASTVPLATLKRPAVHQRK
jgi:hypothetical protein